jgi:hypothetical protein
VSGRADSRRIRRRSAWLIDTPPGDHFKLIITAQVDKGAGRFSALCGDRARERRLMPDTGRTLQPEIVIRRDTDDLKRISLIVTTATVREQECGNVDIEVIRIRDIADGDPSRLAHEGAVAENTAS